VTVWRMGDGARTRHSASPQTSVAKRMTQVMSGGFEKQPQARSRDHDQYWASSKKRERRRAGRTALGAGKAAWRMVGGWRPLYNVVRGIESLLLIGV
jgi:hypothetical protein